jgi:DnaJ-class molecular chaperone
VSAHVEEFATDNAKPCKACGSTIVKFTAKTFDLGSWTITATCQGCSGARLFWRMGYCPSTAKEMRECFDARVSKAGS